jgi:hypothetical protein
LSGLVSSECGKEVRLRPMRRRSAWALMACNPRRRNSAKDRPFSRRIGLITKWIVFEIGLCGCAERQAQWHSASRSPSKCAAKHSTVRRHRCGQHWGAQFAVCSNGNAELARTMNMRLAGFDGAVRRPSGKRCLRSQKATLVKCFHGTVDCTLLEIIGQ